LVEDNSFYRLGRLRWKKLKGLSARRSKIFERKKGVCLLSDIGKVLRYKCGLNCTDKHPNLLDLDDLACPKFVQPSL